MPLRRSCFVASEQIWYRARPEFQCHYGVPASGSIRPCWPWRGRCFNATTAFLLPAEQARTCAGFLCCFNATTAFLLLIASFSLVVKCFQVSMPLRRSCFALDGLVYPPGRPQFQCHYGVPASSQLLGSSCPDPDRFNATTAFLLPHRERGEVRSATSFNATTAFLLPLQPEAGVGPGVHSFNATTAFLLRVPLSACAPVRDWGFNATTAFLLRKN